MKLPKKFDALVGEDKSLEDDDENFLNPEDLSIVDEKTWEPSDEEILSYALKLGYDIEKDPDELFEVAYYYMKYPLPAGWKRAIYKKTKELMYINMEDGEIELATEIEEMAHQMYLEKKEEMMGKKNLAGASPQVDKEKKLSALPPVKEKNGSKNSLLNSELEKELDKNKENKDKKDKKEINIELLEKINDKDILDKDKERKKNNDDIFGISQEPKKNNDIQKEESKKNIKENEEDNKNKSNKKEKEIVKDKEKEDLYGMNAEESEEEKEYGDDFDFDGLEEDSDGHKGEPLIKSIINKEKEKIEKEKEEEEEDELEQLMKQKLEKENKEKKEKEEKERILKEEEEKKEKLKREMEIKQKELNDKLEKDKKEYLNKKLKELQNYKEEKKQNYEKLKKNNISKNNKIKEESQIKFDKELKTEKEKLQSQFKQKLEFYEAELINKKLVEEKKYREQKEYNYKERQKELLKKKEKEIEEKNKKLKEKKSKLLKEIKEERSEKEKLDINYKEKKLNIENNIKLLEEQKKIKLKNIDKKHDLNIEYYEIESEKKFSKEKEALKESFQSQSLNNISSSNLNFSLSGINNNEDNDFIKSKIMDTIQKAMDEEYEINCRSIEQNLMNNKMKEIEKYNTNLMQEKEFKIKNYKNEISLVEKDYYKYINLIRQNSQNKRIDNDNYINKGFEETLKQNEETKNKISKDNKKFMELFLEGVQKLLKKNNTLEQTEIQVEEFLIELKDKYYMILQKNKNKYEMIEYDYKTKKIFIKYLLDVIHYLSKIYSSSSVADIYDIDKKYISENLYKYCKDKINFFKLKFQNKKSKKIFKFLNQNLLGQDSYLNNSDYDDTRESSTAFVNSFKRKSENYNSTNNDINMNIKNNDKNEKNIDNNNDIINKINIDESINNINKNSFIFKNHNLAESMNNFMKLNSFNNINNDIINNHNLFKTLNLNDYNTNTINDGFFRNLNYQEKVKENTDIKIEYYSLEQNTNFLIPLIPEKILDQIDEEILSSYSEIISFLKNEYLKLIEIEKNQNSINNGKNNKKTNIKLNLLILEKIKIYIEEAFNYIINNYYKKEKKIYIEKKIQIIKGHINDFKQNFNVDKYLSNPNSYKTISFPINNLKNSMNINNGQDKDELKNEYNGMNNMILKGNIEEIKTK